MKFRTEIPLIPRERKIGYQSKLLLLGSCFVENMGEKLDYYKFSCLQNPFGILFHPAAIKGFLEKVKEQYRFSEKDIFHHNEAWHSFDAHSALSQSDKTEMLQQMNSAVEETHSFLQETSHVIITLGTAWGYKLAENNKTVANCHKLPQKNFRKELMEVEEDLRTSVELIRDVNSECHIIFTVSPVRHLRDGFIENQQSKARLITAVHKLLNSKVSIDYFPSYEIMMDELRDYRFYAEDMLHPNKTAIDYIWKRFSESYMTSETIAISEEVGNIRKGLAHRPFNKNSEAHHKFRETLQGKIRKLQERIPDIRF